MIALNVTLYRFVCDPAVSHAHPDLERTPFICEWFILPRKSQSHFHLYSQGRGGSTAPEVFAWAGDSMALGFRNYNAHVELDGDTEVIAFAVRSAHQQPSRHLLARGTLDPVPFLGRPSKSYAIKLRDAAGDVMGRLLFSMGVCLASQIKVPVKENTTLRGASVDAHRLHKNQEFGRGVPKSEDREKSGGSNGNGSHGHGHGDHDNINNNDTTSSCKSNDNSRFNNNVNQSAGQVPHKTKDVSSRSPPYSETTQCNSLEVSPGRDNSQNHASINAPGLTSLNSVKNTDEEKPENLLIDVEKVVIKNESINLDNPAPLLLGGLYHAKVRYGKSTLCTPTVECRSPKEIVYSYRLSFTEVPGNSDKLRFSLWENEHQVAGFSLEPSKFRVAVGGHKEYSIPFRYYPTRQAASLEVTVHRIGSEKNNDDRDVGLVAKEDVTTRQRVPEQEQEQEVVLGSPPSPPVRGTITYQGEGQTLLHSNNPSLVSHAEDISSLVHHSSLAKGASSIKCEILAKDYVKKRYSSPTVRQSQWETAIQQGKVPNKRYQVEKEEHIQKYEEERHPCEDGNQPNVIVLPLRKKVLDAPPQQTQLQQNQQPNRNVQQKQEEESLRNLEEKQEQREQERRRPQSQSQHRTGDTLLSCINQSERRNDSENVNRVQAFLNQIAHSSTRSSSATRQPTQGLEVPRLTPRQRGPSSRVCNTSDELRWSGRNHTPLRSHNSGAGGFRQDRLDGRRQLSEWSSDDNNRRGRSRMAWPYRPACISEVASDRTSTSDIIDTRERLADSLLSRLERPPGFRTSLMEEWLEWREARVSTRGSRTSSVHSAFSRDDSVASIASRNRATSPLPTKTVADAAEQRPYQPQYVHRSPSRKSHASGRPPIPMR